MQRANVPAALHHGLGRTGRPILWLPCGPPAGSGDFPTHAAWPGKARRPAIALLDLLAAARRQTHRESRPGWWWCMSAGPNGENCPPSRCPHIRVGLGKLLGLGVWRRFYPAICCPFIRPHNWGCLGWVKSKQGLTTTFSLLVLCRSLLWSLAPRRSARAESSVAAMAKHLGRIRAPPLTSHYYPAPAFPEQRGGQSEAPVSTTTPPKPMPILPARQFKQGPRRPVWGENEFNTATCPCCKPCTHSLTSSSPCDQCDVREASRRQWRGVKLSRCSRDTRSKGQGKGCSGRTEDRHTSCVLLLRIATIQCFGYRTRLRQKKRK